MKDPRIIRGKGLENARELGGLPAAGGKRVRKGRLIRSGALANITEADGEMLRRDYDLRTVIDLRMPAETDSSPDKKIEGVETVFCPLLDESYLGVTRDEYSMQAWLKLYRENKDVDPEEIFKRMYLRIAFDETSLGHIKTFFGILLNNESGSVLWHCSAGKDRVGITTALLLLALGVPRDVVVDDYCMTEKLTRRQLLKVKLLSPLMGYVGRTRKAIIVLFSAKESYLACVLDEIDRQCGSVENYLINKVGLEKSDLEKLREMYLEEK